MTAIYEIPIKFNVGKALPTMGEVLDEVNATMASFGFSEELSVFSDIFTMTMTVDRTLTPSEEVKMRETVQEHFQKSLPQLGIHVDKLRLIRDDSKRIDQA